MDIKEYCQIKADEYAIEIYDMSFYDLSEEQQSIVYDRALASYQDHIANAIDKMRELVKYK